MKKDDLCNGCYWDDICIHQDYEQLYCDKIRARELEKDRLTSEMKLKNIEVQDEPNITTGYLKVIEEAKPAFPHYPDMTGNCTNGQLKEQMERGVKC